MRRLFQIAFWLIPIIALLAACSGDSKEATIAENGDVFTADSRLYPAQNISAIGRSPNPFFLNSYADW